jgi:SCY1-like protein 1
MSQHLEKNKLNAAVFEPLCSGFNDSSPALRELTLKATFGLVPYLNAPNLEKLSRYLVRLQSDSETSIRTNAVIFVARLAPHLSENSMQKMLLPAYARAMKDPFLPCRLAGVQSTLKTKELFTMNDIATKVLPCVMPLLLDPAPNVRQEAFHVVNDFLISLKQESDRMETIMVQQQQQQAAQQQHQQHPSQAGGGGGGGAPLANGATTAVGKKGMAPAPASGSYLSGLSSWMSSSAKPETGAMAPSPSSGPAPPPPRAAAAAVAAPVPHYNSTAPPVRQFAATSLAAPSPPADNDGWGDEEEEDDGWGDEDDGGNDLGMSNIGKNTIPIATTNALLSSSTPFSTPNQFDEDDDPFASIGMKTMTSTVVRPRGKLILPKKKSNTSTITLKPKAAAAPATKLKMDDDEIVDGWDDF